MKYNPVKKVELSVPHTLTSVREILSKAAAPKRQKNTMDPDYRTFYGKIGDGSFKLTPNTGHRDGYTPVISGELTEVTESKPGSAEEAGLSRVFTKMSLDMKLRPLIKTFTVIWLVLCVALLGLAVWQCFRKGFTDNWWLLLIGPGLLLIERIICNIGFRRSARRAAAEIKKLLG